MKRMSVLFLILSSVVFSVGAMPMPMPIMWGPNIRYMGNSGISSSSQGQKYFGEKSFSDFKKELAGLQSAASSRNREIAATKAEAKSTKTWTGYIPGIRGLFRFKDKVRPEVQQAARNELDRRIEGLSAEQQCLEGFKQDVNLAKTQISPLAKDIERIGQNGLQNGRDYRVAKDVNSFMKKPYQNLDQCLSSVDVNKNRFVKDPVVKAEMDVTRQLVGDAPEKYQKNIKLIEQAERQYQKGQSKIEAEQQRAELKEWCAQQGSSWDCWLASGKLTTGDSVDWITDGWYQVAHKLGDVKDYIRETDWNNLNSSWNGKLGEVRDLGVNNQLCKKSPTAYYAAQSGKVVGGVALAALGLYTAFKLGQLGYRGAGFLKCHLWDNRSKKVKALVLLGLAATTTVAPGTAIAVAGCL